MVSDWWGRYTSELVIDPVYLAQMLVSSEWFEADRGRAPRLCRSTYRWRFNPAHHFRLHRIPRSEAAVSRILTDRGLEGVNATRASKASQPTPSRIGHISLVTRII